MLKLKKFSKNDSPASIWSNPIHFIACGFGAGAITVAPGTWGTLAAVPIYLALSLNLNLFDYLMVLLLYSVLAMYCIQRTDADWKTHDHPATVADEIVGFLVTMIAVPPDWFFIIVGFILFRLFDIFKPWPIGWIDRRVSGGFGVVLDDVLAGIYSWLILSIWMHTGWY